MTTSLDSSQRLRKLLAENRPLVMGVLNATPDSFSGDGLALDLDALVRRALQQIADGADILDIGGESTRPGATPVPEQEELDRVLPLIERLANETDAPLSIDTLKSTTARAATRSGAGIVNDVSGLLDPDLANAAAESGSWLVLTHNRASAKAHRDALGGYYPEEVKGNILREVELDLRRQSQIAQDRGVPAENVIYDPGLGFGKAPRESLELLKRTGDLRELMAPNPLLIGPSRKSFVGRALGLPVEDRLEGTLAAVAVAVFRGGHIVRVHDVREASRVARMAWAINRGRDAELLA